MDKIINLGQVYTDEYVAKIISNKLIRNHTLSNASVLEPSCGEGAFIPFLLKKFNKYSFIEIEENDNTYICFQDFFDLEKHNKYTTIIGNPPYVRYKDVLDSTKDKLSNNLLDKRANLYMFFMEKCISHLEKNGELIFIVPHYFLKATSCINLNEYMFKNGTFTDVIFVENNELFKGFSPECIIFRYEKDNLSHKTNIYKSINNFVNDIYTVKNTICNNGQVVFSNNKLSIPFNKLFYVKVGGVSGKNVDFINKGNTDFVYSETYKTNTTRKMLYNDKWIRKCYISSKPRIYVNYITRCKKPFFTHSAIHYEGSVLGIFPINDNIDILKAVELLNNIDWVELGFYNNGRYIFTQNALESILLPDEFNILLK